MNLKNLFAKLSLIVVLLAVVAANTFAATIYVSNTNGNDIVGAGTALSPYKTIAKALTVAADGDVIMIDADTYNEANVAITKSVTLVSQAFNALTTVTITNGVTINGAGKTVNIGTTASGSLAFNLGSTNTALVLTSGTLNITQANVTIASTGRITRTAATINETPTTTNVSVYYTPGSSIAAGPELPASLGSGNLDITAGSNTVTFSNDIAFTSGAIVVNSGSATFSGNVSVNADAPAASFVSNLGTGTVSFANAIAGTRATDGATTTILSNAAGVLTLTGGVTPQALSARTFGFGLTNGAGTINVGPGTYSAAITNSTAAGTINLLSSVTFSNNAVSNGNASAVIKLNGYQLTLSGTAATLTNTGNIISTTASAIGSGMLNITGVVTTTGAGQLPNVTIASGGKLTFGAALSIYGDVTLASSVSGAITDGGFIVTLYGNFNRTNNAPGNYTATGTLTFASSTAQSCNPGASLVLNNVVVNKGSGSVLSLAASLEATGNLTITAGSLDVSNFNLNLTGSAKTFTNSGNAYSSTGVGYVVFQSADAGGVGTTAVTGTITGSGNFGNVLINLVDPVDFVATSGSVTMSGTLYINSGYVRIANGDVITFNNSLVTNPTIKILTTGGTQGLARVAAGSGTVLYSANVNLEYLGTAAYNVNSVTFSAAAATGGLEWIIQPLKLNNVTINATNTVTGYAGASTIAGTLTVVTGGTLAQGANIYTLSGDNKTHSIVGTVTGGTLLETGTGSAVTGSAVTADAATVNSLSFEPVANGASFTSTNLKVISGNLTLQGASTFNSATATVTMNSVTSTLTGNLAVGNATVGPVASVTINGSTTSVLTGNVALTNGTLTLTRGGNSVVIGGTVTLTAGTLNLGSNVSVTGATAQVDGGINAGGFKYTQLGSGASPDYNRTGTGAFTNGTLSLNSTAAAIDLTPGTAFSVPNMESVGTANGVTVNAGMTVSNLLLLDNAATFTQTGVLTVSGNTVTVTDDAGAFTGALTLSGTAATLTLGKSYTIPTFEVNTTGTITLVTDDASATTPTPRTLTTTVAFTKTQGILALGYNHLTTGSGTFTIVVGDITETTGILTWNTAGAITIPASGFSIDNLTVSTAADVSTSAFTVVKNLVLNANLTTSADGKLTLGDGCLVTRTDNTAVLNKIPTFGANTDLKYKTYTGAAVIAMAKEAPATIRNLTVEAGAANISTADNRTITGTLSLADLLDVTSATPDAVVTMADGSTLELKVNGTAALDADLTKAGTMDLVYNGATATTTRELGAVSTSGAYAAYAGDVTVKSTVALTGGTLVLNGDLTFNGGNFDLNGNALGIGGDVSTVASAGGTFVASGSAFLNFVGAEDTQLGLDGTWSPVANIKFRLNKTNATNTVTLVGGGLNFATNIATLYFQNGVLVTGDNIVTLKHTNASGQPSQGFDRTGVTGTKVSHVNGNVKKALTIVGNGNAAVDLTRVEFPVGNTEYYRPMAFQFTTLPTSNVTLTVAEVEASPDGENGFPLTSGNLTITNYPDFHWSVKSDLTLQPAVTYDIEATAAGYTDYETDGIQNVRFIRRFANNIDNPWIVQGGTSYDNSTDGTSPVVIVRSATGAISTQGALFTYSQLNKAPVISEPANITVDEGETVEITWTVNDPDIGQTPTVAIVSKPAAATFNATTKKLTWATTSVDAGTYSVILSATDGVLTSYDTVSVVVNNINNGPSFAATGATVHATATAKYGEALSLTYKAIDADVADVITYSLVYDSTAVKGAAAITTAGVFTYTPVFAEAGKSFTFEIIASDGGLKDTTETIVTVGYAKNLGDVNLSGSVTAADATPILEYVVGLTTLTAEQLYYADVNKDGVVGALDAAWVLYAALHNGTFPTAKAIAAKGDVEFGSFTSENDVLALPISLAKTSGVLSVYTEINLGSNVEFKSVTSRLPEGWIVSSKFENGVLKVAMAGTDALSDGNYAVVNLALANKEEVVTVNASTKLNDESSSTMVAKLREIPAEFALSQNYPNPFNPTTSIKYQIAQNANVKLVVYNMLGQVVKTLVNQEQEAGYYTIRWNGTNDFGGKVSSGIYIYRIIAGDFISTVKMNLLK
jgi:hypothetical protein